MVFAEIVDFIVAWLSCLHADTLVLFCSMYMELVIQKWCGKNEGACWGMCREEKTSLCIRCNPKLCIESQPFYRERIFVFV